MVIVVIVVNIYVFKMLPQAVYRYISHFSIV